MTTAPVGRYITPSAPIDFIVTLHFFHFKSFYIKFTSSSFAAAAASSRFFSSCVLTSQIVIELSFNLLFSYLLQSLVNVDEHEFKFVCEVISSWLRRIRTTRPAMKCETNYLILFLNIYHLWCEASLSRVWSIIVSSPRWVYFYQRIYVNEKDFLF